MKTNSLYIGGLLLLAMSGCTDDEMLAPASNGVRFIGVIESAKTRTVITDDPIKNDRNRIAWEVGRDKVAICCDEPNVKEHKSGIYGVLNVTSEGAAVFQLEAANSGLKTVDGYNYAVYPYDATFNNGVFSYNIPAEYTYTDYASVIRNSLMVARIQAPADGESTVELNFTKAQSILRLCLNAYDKSKYSDRKVKTVVLQSASNYLNGTAQVSWSGATPPSAVINSGTEENKKLTITLETPQALTHYLDDDDHIEVYLPIVPLSFEANDLTITLLDEEGALMYSKTVGQAFEVARGAIQGLKHTLDKPDSLPVPDGATVVSNLAELKAGFSSGKRNFYLNDGTYRLDVAPPSGTSLVFTGSKNAVLWLDKLGTRWFDGKDVVFNGLTVDFRNENGTNQFTRGSSSKSSTFNDCNIVGQFFGYSGDYNFKNCYIDSNDEHIWFYGASSMTFRNCEFYNKRSRAILLYQNGGKYKAVVNIHNCHFFADGVYMSDLWPAYSVVVEIQPVTNDSEVNFTGNNTISATYEQGLYKVWDAVENCKVTINGVEVN